MLNKIVLLSAFLFTTPLFAAPPYDSVSITGEFAKADHDYLYTRLSSGLRKAKAETERSGAFFTHLNSDQYHISCGIFESTTPDAELGQSEVDAISQLAGDLLKQDGNANGYKGKMYGLYAFVHGYDEQGNELHRHYKNPDVLKKILPGGPDKLFGPRSKAKITHVHFVLRFGTNPTDGADGQPGELQKDMHAFMDTIGHLKNELNIKDMYEGRGDFTGHLTVGVMKSFQGKADSTKRALNKQAIVDAYEHAYASFDKWNTHQLKTGYKTFTLNDLFLRGEKKAGSPRFEKIADL